ncbi:uncharacterized protein BKA55DRAFT_668039 [Fusarium redolens]|uniref:Heterokaryon incompatibility domain-containing protein n=1 Tax=Fusarium redolens TaxID=48865 RepID=A0A9P9FXH3_FUSRE|nr:uncharacterized protein BKA55DRAFT_668039 [Fusarium redolens]KAH7224300.1 hypothetical protein BKA55DRAFT_668039 [Fusarium redolens]
MSPFQYPRLPPLELRLLELQPGLPEDPLVGTLLQRKLSPEDAEIPDYEALSYCWGDQSHPQRIKLKTPWRKVAQISYLWALRYHDRKRILWCDFICINQKDVAERSAQTYCLAGPCNAVELYGHGDNALDCSWYRGVTPNFAPTADGSRQEIDCDGPLPLSQDQWLALEQLLAVDWFRRLWTHQEVALANKETSVMRLGDEEMLWNKFMEAALFTCVYTWAASGPFFLDPARHVRNIEVFIYKALSTGSVEESRRNNLDWVALLGMTNLYDCFNDRDRLFALRRLLEPDAAQTIRVDYTKSAKQIMASASVAHLKQRRNLRFLELCNSTISPSWAADLQRPLDRIQLCSNASAKSAASARLIKPGVLEAAGVSCDGICSKPFELPMKKRFYDPEDHIANDSCLDELIAMMTFSYLLDYSAFRTESPPSSALVSLESGRRMIRQWITGTVNLDDDFRLLYNPRRVVATACTRTRNGTVVGVPLESCDGNIIVTLLGMSSNLVLRPQPRDGSHKVVGPCYHPCFSNGQALLGDDFRGWERRWCMDRGHLVFWKEGEPPCLSDPRLDGVPLPAGYTERTVETVGKDTLVWVHEYPYEDYRENNIACDPRMSEHELKNRGVPIQRFRLI